VKQGNFTLSQPTFTLFPTLDPVANWEKLAEELQSVAFLKKPQTKTIATSHWPQEEKPEEFNGILKEWLKSFCY